MWRGIMGDMPAFDLKANFTPMPFGAQEIKVPWGIVYIEKRGT